VRRFVPLAAVYQNRGRPRRTGRRIRIKGQRAGILHIANRARNHVVTGGIAGGCGTRSIGGVEVRPAADADGHYEIESMNPGSHSWCTDQGGAAILCS
jgi:hypothetical protein